MRRLSIVIVSYNSANDLERCLGSLTRPAPAIDHEIVVVDNGSTDGTPAYVRANWPGVRLIEAGGNVGFAKANNVAIRDTWSELVLLLNPDTEVPAGAVDRLAAAIDARPDVAAVGPRIVDANGRAELSFGAMISPFAELRQKVLVTGHDRTYPVIAGLVERMTRRSAEVDWVSGACLLARRADIEAVGLLDERFFMYTEDVDVCAAMRKRGRRILFTADAEIRHLRGRSRASAPAATDAAYRRSQIAFYEKHHPRWAPFLKCYLKLKSR
jgi:GT2 family glycosyltransferase